MLILKFIVISFAPQKIENKRLREELDKYKNQEKTLAASLSPIEAEAMQLDKQEIEIKFEERQRLDEQRDRDRQFREKQLAIAREYKRQMKPVSALPMDSDVSPRSKMPLFDRSNKPQTMSIDMPAGFNTALRSQPCWTFDRERDFSPVPGSMVSLKISFLIHECMKNCNCILNLKAVYELLR